MTQSFLNEHGYVVSEKLEPEVLRFMRACEELQMLANHVPFHLKPKLHTLLMKTAACFEKRDRPPLHHTMELDCGRYAGIFHDPTSKAS